MPQDSTSINNENLIEELDSGLYKIDKIYEDGATQETVLIYKMRTFKRNAPECASHEVDPCMLLRVGKIYRATRLDELPQILNVILGDMSLVGPRPCLSSQLQLIEIRTKASIFDVKPGITGLSQCLGIDMRHPKVLVDYDEKMIKEMSLAMYIKILYQTLRKFLKVVIIGRLVWTR